MLTFTSIQIKSNSKIMSYLPIYELSKEDFRIEGYDGIALFGTRTRPNTFGGPLIKTKDLHGATIVIVDGKVEKDRFGLFDKNTY